MVRGSAGNCLWLMAQRRTRQRATAVVLSAASYRIFVW